MKHTHKKSNKKKEVVLTDTAFEDTGRAVFYITLIILALIGFIWWMWS